MPSFNWQALSPFGVRIDLDVSKNIADDTIAKLRNLFDRYHLLFFPNQKLSYEEQQRVSAWFGPIVSDSTPSYISTDPDVGRLGNSELPFHSDLTCTPHPFLGLSLHAVDVTPETTSTIFIDAVRAAAAIPQDLREQINTLHGMHLWPASLTERQRSSDAPDDWPGAVHPVLMPHPRTGKILLCMNANHTDRIVELKANESDRLIEILFGYLYDDNNKYEHKWQNGDLLVWDNIALQHARPEIPAGITRTLQRVTLGTHTFMELIPPQVLAAYNVA